LATSTVRIGGGSRLRTRWLLVLAYVALIFTLSAQPGLTVPGTFEYRDKLAHTLEYGGLGVLAYRAVRDTWPRTPALRRALLTVLAISILGMLDEKFQSFIPGRDSTVYDWMADTFGATLAQVVGGFMEQRRRGTA
jgi:VanZ family protein